MPKTIDDSLGLYVSKDLGIQLLRNRHKNESADQIKCLRETVYWALLLKRMQHINSPNN